MSQSIDHDRSDHELQRFWSDRIEQAVLAVSAGPSAAAVIRQPDVRSEQMGRAGQSKGVNNAPPIIGVDSCIKLVLPGSFNPLHRGHVRMAEFASRKMRIPAWFELSLVNADKAEIDAGATACRLLPSLTVNASAPQTSESAKNLTGPACQNLEVNSGENLSSKNVEKNSDAGSLDSPVAAFSPHGLIVSAAPTYAEKAKLFPDCTFVLGTDTLIRVADKRFYNGSEKARETAFSLLQSASCRFLVFGRKVEGVFVELQDLVLPESLAQMCDGVDEREFREDISSTELRD